MARRCDFTKRGVQAGNNVSHANVGRERFAFAMPTRLEAVRESVGV